LPTTPDGGLHPTLLDELTNNGSGTYLADTTIAVPLFEGGIARDVKCCTTFQQTAVGLSAVHPEE